MGRSAGEGIAASILLVEDEPAVRLVLAAALTQAGHRVLAVAGLEEGRRLLAGGGFDLVVSDLALADGDGAALLDAAAAAGLPSVGVTGDPSRMEDAPRPGRALLAKPFRPERLVEVAAALLGPGGAPRSDS